MASVGLIIGAVGVCLAILLVVAVLAVMFICWRKRQHNSVGQSATPHGGVVMDAAMFETLGARTKTSRKIMLHELSDRVCRMHNDHDFLFQAEFERLHDVSATLPADRSSLTAAKEENMLKNRFVDVLPYNDTRVKLRGGASYINASFIDGYNRHKEYISTQGPLSDDERRRSTQRQSTVDDFWRMIWQYNVSAIVMLTSCVEDYKPKCAFYWPPTVNEVRHFGDIVATLTAEQDQEICVVRKIVLHRLSTPKAEARLVTQWQFKGWEDAKGHQPERLLQFVNMVRNQTVSQRRVSEAPLVVHCSAGIGRSGTYIALDYLLHHVRDHDHVDVLNCVHTMRSQRVRMVQTLEQYTLLYDCLTIAAKKKLNERNRQNQEDGLHEQVILKVESTPSSVSRPASSASAFRRSKLPSFSSTPTNKKPSEQPSIESVRTINETIYI